MISMKTTKLSYKAIGIISLLFFMGESYSADQTAAKNYLVITGEQWSAPKNVDTILALPALQTILTKIFKEKNLELLIRYPRGEVGILWATELKAWLVALGLDSGRMVLQAGSHNANEIELITR